MRSERRVSIKHTRRDTKEIEIGRFLASIQDGHNHSVSLCEVMDDTQEPEMCFMVMPYLRPFNDPEFEAVGEVVDFVMQTLEVCLYPTLLPSLLYDVYRRASRSCTSIESPIGELILWA